MLLSTLSSANRTTVISTIIVLHIVCIFTPSCFLSGFSAVRLRAWLLSSGYRDLNIRWSPINFPPLRALIKLGAKMIWALLALRISKLMGQASIPEPHYFLLILESLIPILPLLEIAGLVPNVHWLPFSVFTSGASKPRETQMLLQDRPSSLYN